MVQNSNLPHKKLLNNIKKVDLIKEKCIKVKKYLKLRVQGHFNNVEKFISQNALKIIMFFSVIYRGVKMLIVSLLRERKTTSNIT